MTLHYPLLVSAGESGPGESLVVGQAAACVSITGAPNTVDINPADYITGLQDDDYVVLLLTQNTNIDYGEGVMSAAGWTNLLGGANVTTSNARFHGALGGFWDSASPTTTFAVPVSAYTATICFLMYAFRGVSHIKPVEVHWASNVDAYEGTGFPTSSPYFEAVRPHAYQSSAALLYACFYELGTGNSDPFVTLSDANIIAGSGTVADYRHTRSGLGHVIAALVRPSNDADLVNLIGSSRDLSRDDPGFTLSGLGYEDSGSTADFDKWEYYFNNGTTEYRTLTAASFSATAGDNIVVSLVGQTYVPSSGADFGMVIVITDPGGTTYARGFAGAQPRTHWDGNFDNTLDYFFQQFSSTAGYNGGLYGVFLPAPSTGTYTVKVYVAKEGAALNGNWTAGTGTTTSRCRYLSGGIAVNGVPFVRGDFAGSSSEFAYENSVPPVLFRAPTASQNYNVAGDFVNLVMEIIPAGTTLRQAGLDAMNGIGGVSFSESSRPFLTVSGAQSNALQQPGIPVWADTVVLPTYRTSEAGADTNGKYYWEVTVPGGANASTTWSIGLAWAGAGGSMTAIPSTGGDYFPVIVLGDGKLYENGTLSSDFGSFSAGTIIGFALDINAGTCGIYVDGTLSDTLDLTTHAGGANLATRAAYRFFGHLDGGSATNVYEITANLKGPFTYTKPSGYVAYDFANEVA